MEVAAVHRLDDLLCKQFRRTNISRRKLLIRLLGLILLISGCIQSRTTSPTLKGKSRHLESLRFHAGLSLQKHCAGVNCLALLKSSSPGGSEYLFTGSRDGTLKRWALAEDGATCCATFESHIDWVNDTVLTGNNTLVSCSSDTTVKVWNGLSEGSCTRTLGQHSDYVTCLASAEKNSNVVASAGLGGEVYIWDLEGALSPTSKSSDATAENCSNGVSGAGSSVSITSVHPNSSSNTISLHTKSQGYIPVSAKGHKESVYALAMNDSGSLLVSGGTEKVLGCASVGSKNWFEDHEAKRSYR